MDSIDFSSIFIIAFALSADCFAVALGCSTSSKFLSPLQVLRVYLSFGFFQAFMPTLGRLMGQTVVDLIATYDHWAAFILLVLVGGRMIWESFGSRDGSNKNDITKWFILLTLSVATSIDALAIGLTLAFLNVNLVLAVSTIGIVAVLVTAIGFVLGRKAGKLIGKRAETFGGVIILGIGIRILIGHLG